jgi:TFIIF-interacting CTD phosphatase-like protein
LEEFLKEAARYFEIYVYTMGSYTYAQKIVQIITEACHLPPDFFVYNRVVTRDHTKSTTDTSNPWPRLTSIR